MDMQIRTLVTIVAERVLRDRVVEALQRAGARGYTLTDVIGEGTRHIAAHEWEGPSVKIETLVSEEMASQIVTFVSDRYFEHHSIIVYTSEVRVLRGDRF
jgi:nitrogen regulatory protein P-II 2